MRASIAHWQTPLFLFLEIESKDKSSKQGSRALLIHHDLSSLPTFKSNDPYQFSPFKHQIIRELDDSNRDAASPRFRLAAAF